MSGPHRVSRRFVGGERAERQRVWSVQRLSGREEDGALGSSDQLCGLRAGSKKELKG